MFAGTALSVHLLVYAGLSLFIINGPYVYMVICVFYTYNLTLDSEEATHCYHCHLICIKGHVETVDTKDQSNAIVYGIFVDTVNTKIKACKRIECYVC